MTDHPLDPLITSYKVQLSSLEQQIAIRDDIIQRLENALSGTDITIESVIALKKLIY